jgi:hypothetical protein
VAAARDLPGFTVVVGHSGAGIFLPEIGRLLPDGASALVFVDAVLPPEHGVHTTPERLNQMLDSQTHQGVLARWLDWWPEDIIGELLSDPADRAVLLEDMPRLPRAFYDEVVHVPDMWSETPCGYVRLSGGYDGEVEEAQRRRWPTRIVDGSHLSIYSNPSQVLESVTELIDELSA